MSKRYSLEHKNLVLRKWEENGGDINLTSLQTGIPERTLRQWRQERQRQLPPPQNSERRQIPEFKSDLEALDFMRRQMLDELLALSTDLQGSFGVATPYQRIQILSRLLDRLMTLDEHLKPYQPRPQTIFRVVGSEGEEPYGRTEFIQRPYDLKKQEAGNPPSFLHNDFEPASSMLHSHDAEGD